MQNCPPVNNFWRGIWEDLSEWFSLIICAWSHEYHWYGCKNITFTPYYTLHGEEKYPGELQMKNNFSPVQQALIRNLCSENRFLQKSIRGISSFRIPHCLFHDEWDGDDLALLLMVQVVVLGGAGGRLWVIWCLGYLASGGVGIIQSQMIWHWHLLLHRLQWWVFALMPWELVWDCRWLGGSFVYFILRESFDVLATSVGCLDRCGGVTESQSLKLVHPQADLHT